MVSLRYTLWPSLSCIILAGGMGSTAYAAIPHQLREPLDVSPVLPNPQAIQETFVAQLIPDTTLGHESSVVTPINIHTDRIDGGAQRGTLLFHSFQDFSIPDARATYFANPEPIQTILSRVTGNDLSQLFGTLGILGEADLIFLNPNGVLFGPNAQLDVQGSLTVSTASGAELPDGSIFSALQPEVPPLLDVDVTAPVGLIFQEPETGQIINEGNLSVEQDFILAANNLALQGQLLAGGNLTLQALDTIQIRDHTAKPFLAVAGGELLVQGNDTVDVFALNHSESGLFSGGDMVLRSRNPVSGDAHYWSRGNFRIEQLDQSLGNLVSPYDPVIRAAGDVSLGGYLGPSLHILAGGSVGIPNGVFITGVEVAADAINGDVVTLSNGEQITINGSTTPTLDIRAGTTAVGGPSPTPIDNLAPFGFFLPPVDINNSDNAQRADIELGNVFVTAPAGMVLLTNQYQPVIGQSGDIQVQDIRTSNTVGGDVIIDSRDNISIVNGTVITSSSDGDSGDIKILAEERFTADRSFLSSVVFGQGNAGLIELQGEEIILNNTPILTIIAPNAVGNTGGIDITTGSLTATNGTQLLSRIFGTGNAGDIRINASGDIFLDGIDPTLVGVPSSIVNDVRLGAQGNSGDIDITARTLQLTNGAFLSASTLGEGNAGRILIDTQENTTFSQSAVLNNVEGTAIGNTGGIKILAGTLFTSESSLVESRTFGRGSAGGININASDTVLLDASDVSSSVELGAIGNSDGIEITTDSLVVQNATLLDTSTSAQGNAGDVNITARDTASFSDNSTVLSSIGPGAVGEGGDINLRVGSLSFDEGAALISSTFSDGDAGDVLIRVNEAALFDGVGVDGISTGILSTVLPLGEGNGGTIDIQAGAITVSNGAQLNASTVGEGEAGSITINTRDALVLEGVGANGASSILSGVAPNAEGSGGTIDLSVGSLSLIDGAAVSTTTGGQGPAGSIFIDARGGDITLSGTGSNGLPSSITSAIAPNLNFGGGDIEILTNELSLDDGATINTTNLGQGNASNIFVEARLISLDNQSSIFARTQSLNGGDIELQGPNLLLLRRGSSISTEAGLDQSGGGGNGGNINIDADFIVGIPVENSDIVANAFDGNGGNIDITAQSIFGLQFRPKLTPLSDITASSSIGIDGTVTIDTLGIDPSQSLSALPDEPVDSQITSTCQTPSNRDTIEFFDLGRGGNPVSPDNILGSGLRLEDWVDLSHRQQTDRITTSHDETSTYSLNSPRTKPISLNTFSPISCQR